MNPRSGLTTVIAMALVFSFLFPAVGSAEVKATSTTDNTDGEVTNEISTGADTNSVYIPQHAHFVPDSNIEIVPCVGYEEIHDRVPRDICDTFANGYAKGLKVYDHYDNQDVCFTVVGPNPVPSLYQISTVEAYAPVLPGSDSQRVYGRYSPKTDQDLEDAIVTYNATTPNTIDSVYPHHANYQVPTVENYYPSGGIHNLYYRWTYSLYQGDGVPPPTRPASYNRDIRPVTQTWSQNILGYQKTITFGWGWEWEFTGYNNVTTCANVWDPNAGPIDPFTGLPTGAYVSVCTTSRGSTQMTTRWEWKDSLPMVSSVVSNTTLPAGLPAWRYDRDLSDQAADPGFGPSRPAQAAISPGCPYHVCTAENHISTYEYDTPSVYTANGSGSPLRYAAPTFWQVWELWGDYESTDNPVTQNILVELKEGPDGDVGPLGIGWIDLNYKDYKVDYFDCYSTRNGGWDRSWRIAVPYPRKVQTSINGRPGRSDSALVKTPVLEPHPQSISGMFTDSRTPRSDSAPPVHVPIPIFDIGSGVKDNPIAPDGNWWAVVRSIPPTQDPVTLQWEYINCVDVGGIPVCLAEAYRPWRAIWYIEPPPDDVTATPQPDPTPRDVRVCAYSTSSTHSLLADQSHEQANWSHPYQVAVDTYLPDAAMMHTLQDLKTSNLNQLLDWLEDWLYGTGSNLARSRGQDQVNPDRYCWYKWFQAHNTFDGADGYRGVLAVEWLATFYLGVPWDPNLYCVTGNAHPGIPPGPPGSGSSATFTCSNSLDTRSDVAYRFFRMAAADWDAPGLPSFNTSFMKQPVDGVYQCYVGREYLWPTMDQSFEWFLQGAAILYDNSQDPTTRELMHPLGGGRTPATTLTDTAPASNWWRGALLPLDPGDPMPTLPRVATPQNLASALASNDPDRLYLPGVTELQYPRRLSGTNSAHNPGCEDIPVWRIGIPCTQWTSAGVCSNEEWYTLFGENSLGNDIPGELWAWWGQQIGEVRHQTFPVEVDP